MTSVFRSVRVAACDLLLGLGVLAVLLGVPADAAGLSPEASEPPRVLVSRVATEITPVVADYVAEGLSRAEEGGFDAYVIEMDTPGGLATSMREIIQDILASRVPVIVYVTPEGARAASAGAMITLASHYAAMAPGTNIGAATPVGLGGADLSRKVVNDAAAQADSLARLRDRDADAAVAMVRKGRSFGVQRALEVGIVEAQASSLAAALRAGDGAAATVGEGRATTLDTAGAEVRRFEFGAFRQVLQWLANPNLSYLLMTLGVLGLIYELATPGVGIAGITGAVSLVLGLFSLAVLPVNIVGVILLLLAGALFVAELFAPGMGAFAFGGAGALVLAALFLFDEAQGVAVDLGVALPTAVLMAVLAVLAGRLVLRARRPAVLYGSETLIGQAVTVRQASGQAGRAFVEGEWWSIASDTEPLREGGPARVVELRGLTLVVEPLHPQEGGMP
ncbi:MAG: NfeD family protein [Streptomycetales bacterium]